MSGCSANSIGQASHRVLRCVGRTASLSLIVVRGMVVNDMESSIEKNSRIIDDWPEKVIVAGTDA